MKTIENQAKIYFPICYEQERKGIFCYINKLVKTEKKKKGHIAVGTV